MVHVCCLWLLARHVMFLLILKDNVVLLYTFLMIRLMNRQEVLESYF